MITKCIKKDSKTRKLKEDILTDRSVHKMIAEYTK